jgi:hypothetical protein
MRRVFLSLLTALVLFPAVAWAQDASMATHACNLAAAGPYDVTRPTDCLAIESGHRVFVTSCLRCAIRQHRDLKGSAGEPKHLSSVIPPFGKYAHHPGPSMWRFDSATVRQIPRSIMSMMCRRQATRRDLDAALEANDVCASFSKVEK